MMGTLAVELAKSKIRTDKEVYQAHVTGDIEDVNGVLKITRIHVRYDLSSPEDKKARAKEALETYLPNCPGAQSVIGCIEITHELNFA